MEVAFDWCGRDEFFAASQGRDTPLSYWAMPTRRTGTPSGYSFSRLFYSHSSKFFWILIVLF